MRNEKKNDVLNKLKDQQKILLNQEEEQKSLINEIGEHLDPTQMVLDLTNQLKKTEEGENQEEEVLVTTPRKRKL